MTNVTKIVCTRHLSNVVESIEVPEKEVLTETYRALRALYYSTENGKNGVIPPGSAS